MLEVGDGSPSPMSNELSYNRQQTTSDTRKSLSGSSDESALRIRMSYPSWRLAAGGWRLAAGG